MILTSVASREVIFSNEIPFMERILSPTTNPHNSAREPLKTFETYIPNPYSAPPLMENPNLKQNG